MKIETIKSVVSFISRAGGGGGGGSFIFFCTKVFVTFSFKNKYVSGCGMNCMGQLYSYR